MDPLIVTWFVVPLITVGIAVSVLLIRDIYRDVYPNSFRKKEDRCNELTTKEWILAEVFGRPLPGRFDSKSLAESAVDMGISVREAAQAMTILGNATRLTEKSVRSLGEGLAHASGQTGEDIRETDPYDELMNRMMGRMAEQVDRDMINTLGPGDAGRRGAAAGRHLRDALERTVILRAGLRAELIRIIAPDRRAGEEWSGENVLYHGRDINEMNEVEILDALARLRSPGFGFSSVPELKESVENKTKTEVTKHVKIRQRRKIR